VTRNIVMLIQHPLSHIPRKGGVPTRKARKDDDQRGGRGGTGTKIMHNQTRGQLVSKAPFLSVPSSWRIDRIKSNLVYVSTILSDVTPPTIHKGNV